MGSEWLRLLEEKSLAGEPDYLTFELETALENQVRVIPVLVGIDEVPKAEKLPDHIKALSYLQGVQLNPGREFEHQLNGLVNAVAGRSLISRRLVMSMAGIGLAGAASAICISKLLKPIRDLKILVIMGENVPYENSILSGFQKTLNREGGRYGIRPVFVERIVPKFKEHYASPDSDAGRASWEQVVHYVRTVYSKRQVDYFVCLGTFASQAIMGSGLIAELGVQGMIYLGVTDPVSAGLVGQYKIAGVQYGPGGVAYGRTISDLFDPMQQLVFIYRDVVGNIQDESVARSLRQLNEEYASRDGFRLPRFDIQTEQEDISLEKLEFADSRDPLNSNIYFGWYGLDNILSDVPPPQIMYDHRLWIVPSTYSQSNFELAGIVVSVEDQRVGELGAEIVIQHEADSQLDLQDYPVTSPPFKVWLSRDRLHAKGMVLSDAAHKRKSSDDFEVVQ